jgi:hypothetical protein
VTRRDVTAVLALSCLSGVVRGRAVSAQERGASPAIGDRVNRLERQLEDLRGTLKIPGHLGRRLTSLSELGLLPTVDQEAR